jgi:hypothetical protein
MQSAPNVDKNVKSLSNQIKADQCIAENVTQKEDHPEEIDIRLTSQHLFLVHNLFDIHIFFLSYHMAPWCDLSRKRI